MRGVFFDLDGTLTDPKAGITRCIQHALRELRCDVPAADELTWCIGPPLLNSLEVLAGPARAAEALRLYRERFAAVGLFENTVYPGIEEMLAQLTRQGLPLFVASSKPTVYVLQILEHFSLRDFFTSVYGSELDGTRADKSALLSHALLDAGATASTAVMVGDREHDGVGAASNGMRFIGVAYGYGSVEELEEAGAADIAHSVSQLPTLLLGHS